MSFKSVKFKETKINIVDGDRGKNYPSQDEYLEDGYCLFLNAKNVTDSGFKFNKTKFITKEKDDILRKGKLKKKDVVLTTRGTVGNVGFFTDEISYKNIRINSGMLIFRLEDKNEFLPEYIYWYLRSNLFQNQIKQYVSGSAQPQLPVKTINKMKILKPNIETQKKIVKIISSVNKKVLNNNRMNKTLEKMAQAIYKSWFVDFEPFQDKKFIESELGMIPEGWEVKKLGNIVDILDKKRNPISKRERAKIKGEYPYYGATKPLDYIEHYTYSGRHILVAEDGSVIDENGKPVIQLVEGKFNVSNHAHVLKGNKEISNEFIYLALKMVNIKPFLTGSVQLKLNQTNTKKIKIINPSEEVKNNFNKIVKPMFDKIIENKRENQSLKELRDSLLPKLMSGEIRVPLEEDKKEVN